MEHKINNMPVEILEWLRDRGLTNETIKISKLSWNGYEIIIPVFDKNGILLFYKYRRKPSSFDGPKYRYETGSTASLYNVQTLENITDEPVFICEGELDALLLNSMGNIAVTSTGGSGTFKKEWAKYFDGKRVYIVFDRDDAGYKGAMKVQSLVPHAEIIILPDDFEGNDLTDYFQKFGMNDFFKLYSQSYPIPREPSGIPSDKKELKKVVKEFSDAADTLLEIRRDLSNNRRSVRHLAVMQNYVLSRYETYNNVLKSFDKRNREFADNNDIFNAKQVPITQFIKFNYNGFAPCIFHKEKTGSMKYNKPGTKYPNTVKCYGCGQMADVIDIVQHLNGINLKEALKIILKK